MGRLTAEMLIDRLEEVLPTLEGMAKVRVLNKLNKLTGKKIPRNRVESQLLKLYDRWEEIQNNMDRPNMHITISLATGKSKDWMSVSLHNNEERSGTYPTIEECMMVLGMEPKMPLED